MERPNYQIWGWPQVPVGPLPPLPHSCWGLGKTEPQGTASSISVTPFPGLAGAPLSLLLAHSPACHLLFVDIPSVSPTAQNVVQACLFPFGRAVKGPGKAERRKAEVRSQAGPDVETLKQRLEVLTPQSPQLKSDFFPPLNCAIDTLDRTRKPTGSWNHSLVSVGQQLPILSPCGKTCPEINSALGKFSFTYKTLLR